MTDEEKICCSWGNGRHAYFYTKCPCGRACGYAVQKHAFRAVGRGRADGGAVPAYLYQDNNYFMLRDLGKILGYRVDWNEAKKQASLTKESAAQDLQHLSAAKQAKAVQQSKQTILVGATEYENMNCLNIDGYNYFKLRDLVEIMDFTCGWDSRKESGFSSPQASRMTRESAYP